MRAKSVKDIQRSPLANRLPDIFWLHACTKLYKLACHHPEAHLRVGVHAAYLAEVDACFLNDAEYGDDEG